MIKKYILTNLSNNTVSVLMQKFNEQGEQVGSNWRRAYFNDEKGRQQVEKEIPSPQKNAILGVWVTQPTL